MTDVSESSHALDAQASADPSAATPGDSVSRGRWVLAHVEEIVTALLLSKAPA